MKIQFAEWRTSYEFFSKKLKEKGVKTSIEEFLKFATSQECDETSKKTFILECQWLMDGKPYYNFYPEILEPIAKIRLDKISVKLLTTTNEFKVINLRFSIKDSEIESILVGRMDEKTIHFIIRRHKYPDESILFYISTKTEKTIGEILTDPKSETKGADDSQLEAIRQAIRCYVMAKFLTDCPNEDLIAFDVPERFSEEYFQADSARKETLKKVSRAYGKNGYNIRNYIVHPNVGRLTEPQEHGEGKEQAYAHIRTGHLHAVRCGPGKKDVKIMWYVPIVVNKDKPFKGSV